MLKFQHIYRVSGSLINGKKEKHFVFTIYEVLTVAVSFFFLAQVLKIFAVEVKL